MSFKDRRRQQETPVDLLEKNTGLSVTEFKELVTEMVKEIPGAKIIQPAPVITNEVSIEEIQPFAKRVKKKREDLKEVNKIGLVGDTIEARDFRAICKKNSIQINVALTEILRDWNMAHYNL